MENTAREIVFESKQTKVNYRHLAQSEQAFIQQLAVYYVAWGYRFYVVGKIPDHKDPLKTDSRIIEKYDIAKSKFQRARQKAQGIASIQYLRFDRFFVIIATKGKHEFIAQEQNQIKDIRHTPLLFDNHSISSKLGKDGNFHASVSLEQNYYRDLKAYFLGISSSSHRSSSQIIKEINALPLCKFSPVRNKLFSLLRAINKNRKTQGLSQIKHEDLQLKRLSIKTFV